jgi:hypothetical protein
VGGEAKATVATPAAGIAEGFVAGAKLRPRPVPLADTTTSLTLYVDAPELERRSAAGMGDAAAAPRLAATADSADAVAASDIWRCAVTREERARLS